MPEVELDVPIKSHLNHVLNALLSTGWRLEAVPARGRLLRNGQKIMLRSDQLDLRFRLFVYKVGGSSRNRPEERRIEITSTYQKGLERLRDYPDVVLGYSPDQKMFVGLDPQRIEFGGPTGNASSFVDSEGLSTSRSRGIAIAQRKANIFEAGVEYNAFLSPERLAEYFFNREAVHDGDYSGQGPFSGNRAASSRPSSNSISEKDAYGDVLILKGPKSSRNKTTKRFDDATIEAFENGNIPAPKNRRKITPEEFAELKRLMSENGLLGEEFVLNAERRRLRKAGKHDLAAKVHWISQSSVGEGFDIVSYESSGSKRFIEVKSTVGLSKSFEMSDNEWMTACRLGDAYYICRVTKVRLKPTVAYYCNPKQLEKDGKVTKTPSGWCISLG
jgi:hypothetical protein